MRRPNAASRNGFPTSDDGASEAQEERRTCCTHFEAVQAHTKKNVYIKKRSKKHKTHSDPSCDHFHLLSFLHVGSRASSSAIVFRPHRRAFRPLRPTAAAGAVALTPLSLRLADQASFEGSSGCAGHTADWSTTNVCRCGGGSSLPGRNGERKGKEER